MSPDNILIWTIRSTIVQLIAAVATVGAAIAAWRASTLAKRSLKESVLYREALVQPLITIEMASPPNGGFGNEAAQYHFRLYNSGAGPAIFTDKPLFRYKSKNYIEHSAQNEDENDNPIFVFPDNNRIPSVLRPNDFSFVVLVLGHFDSTPMENPYCFSIIFNDIINKKYLIEIGLDPKTGEILHQKNTKY